MTLLLARAYAIMRLVSFSGTPSAITATTRTVAVCRASIVESEALHWYPTQCKADVSTAAHSATSACLKGTCRDHQQCFVVLKSAACCCLLLHQPKPMPIGMLPSTLLAQSTGPRPNLRKEA